jgi:LAO/AO transport system kinase
MTDLLKKLLNGDRQGLAKAITLIESSREDHQKEANNLILKILAKKRNPTIRIGLSGTPGAGKSTFIEALGNKLIAKGHKIGVLAVDPSSKKTGGSILGDKTRMEKLSKEPNAFIRPSPSKLALGGVTSKTREVILLCEMAGYDVVIVETVGVGQSEIAASEMTDIFCLVITPAGGDELQGLKRGITENADLIIVNKADGELVNAANIAVAQYSAALRLLGKKEHTHIDYPKATMVSSTTGNGLNEICHEIFEFVKLQRTSGLFEKRRKSQELAWFKERTQTALFNVLTKNTNLVGIQAKLESRIINEDLSVLEAIETLNSYLSQNLWEHKPS